MDSIKSLIKSSLNEFVKLDEKAHLEFIEMNPGICRDFKSSNQCLHPNKSSSMNLVNRNYPPCIIEDLHIPSYCDWIFDRCLSRDTEKYRVKSNGLVRYFLEGENLFGTHSYKSVECNCRYTCWLAHRKFMVELTNTQIEERKRFNNIDLKFKDLLIIWQKFYDNYLGEKINEILLKCLNDQPFIDLISYHIKHNELYPHRIKKIVDSGIHKHLK